MARAPYVFADNDVAAQRLRILAETFSASTRAFVAESAIHRPRVVVDLGCGPGHTTHLLADVLQCGLAVGLDSSERFIAAASQTSTEHVVFRRHDVTAPPLPTDPADVLYCRFLLTHLQDPLRAIAGWSTALGPGGRLLIEETEWIETTSDMFRTYMSIVEAMLAAQSNTLYAGRLLGVMAHAEQMRRRESRVARLSVANRSAARLFVLNLRAWRDQPFIRATYRPDVIDRIADELTTLIEDRPDDVAIEWGLRQVVFEQVS